MGFSSLLHLSLSPFSIHYLNSHYVGSLLLRRFRIRLAAAAKDFSFVQLLFLPFCNFGFIEGLCESLDRARRRQVLLRFA